MYNTKIGGKSPVAISYQKHADELKEDSRKLFEQATQSYFGYFEIVEGSTAFLVGHRANRL
jgi:hypothetical protein